MALQKLNENEVRETETLEHVYSKEWLLLRKSILEEELQKIQNMLSLLKA